MLKGGGRGHRESGGIDGREHYLWKHNIYKLPNNSVWMDGCTVGVPGYHPGLCMCVSTCGRLTQVILVRSILSAHILSVPVSMIVHTCVPVQARMCVCRVPSFLWDESICHCKSLVTPDMFIVV